MHCINQLQDVESDCSGNGFNFQIGCNSLLTNTPLYNSNPMSQKAFLNIVPKKRRSTRLQLKYQKQNSHELKNEINKNIVVWKYKSCGQLDIKDTKTNCTRCESLKTKPTISKKKNQQA
eukprot:93261_1